MTIFNDGKDLGYQDDPNWWYKGPNAFRIAQLDEDYPAEYFPLAEPNGEAIGAIVDHVLHQFDKMAGVDATSVIEFGCGGGWISKEFHELGLIVVGFDGSRHAIKAARDRVEKARFYQVDFRNPAPYHGRFDIALCQEVAEHIEPPFASVLVKSLCDASDFIWFSAEPPNTNRPHLHHVNEQPIEYWQALFGFYGYRCVMLPDSIHIDTGERGRCIFLNSKVYK